jgi:hypothetical protein
MVLLHFYVFMQIQDDSGQKNFKDGSWTSSRAEKHILHRFAGHKLSLKDQKKNKVKSQLSTLFAGHKQILAGRKQWF